MSGKHRKLMQPLSAVLAIVALETPALHGISAQTLADVPLAPTIGDCARLAKAHYDRSSLLHKQDMQCLSGGPHFGYCSGGCAGNYTAYRQCCSIEERICTEDKSFSIVNETCLSRARSASDANAEEQTPAADELTKRLHAANSAYDALTTAREAFEDPTTFFLNSLGRQNSLYRQLFDSSDHLKNESLAQEIYQFAFNQGKAGIAAQSTTSSPLVTAVQSESLNLVQRYYGKAFGQLDSSYSQLVKLDVDLKQSLHDYQVQSLHEKVPQDPNKPASRDCSILADDLKSHQLLEEHSGAWIALTARCTK